MYSKKGSNSRQVHVVGIDPLPNCGTTLALHHYVDERKASAVIQNLVTVALVIVVVVRSWQPHTHTQTYGKPHSADISNIGWPYLYMDVCTHQQQQ